VDGSVKGMARQALKQRCPDRLLFQQLVWAWRYTGSLGCLWCGIACASCADNDCPAPGFDQGERFRFTVLSRDSEPEQDCVPLNPGDSFELVAGDWKRDSEICTAREAQPTGAPFGDIDFQFCRGRGNLGLGCREDNDPLVCGASMQIQVGTTILRTDTIIEDGMVQVDWRNQDCSRSCQERFAVRIEILNRL
jgi:hypothetical protein